MAVNKFNDFPVLVGIMKSETMGKANSSSRHSTARLAEVDDSDIAGGRGQGVGRGVD